MAKKMTAGERIASDYSGCSVEDTRHSASMWAQEQRSLAAMIDRAIDNAYQRGRKSVLVLASTLSGIKDQKLPKTFGKIVTTKKRTSSKP